jgi:hypothetical protein
MHTKTYVHHLIYTLAIILQADSEGALSAEVLPPVMPNPLVLLSPTPPGVGAVNLANSRMFHSRTGELNDKVPNNDRTQSGIEVTVVNFGAAPTHDHGKQRKESVVDPEWPLTHRADDVS